MNGDEKSELISIKAAAESLGMKYTTLRSRLKKRGVEFVGFPNDHHKYMPLSVVKQIRDEREAYEARLAVSL